MHPDLASFGWEKAEYKSYQALVHALRPGDVFIDVGAYVGAYSVIAAKIVGSTGRVVAYEPSTRTHSYLAANLRYNNLVNAVIVRQICCGAHNGEIDFYQGLNQLESTNSILPVAGYRKTNVPVNTLDHEMASLGLSPKVIKIDAEGGEWDILQGATHVLRTCRPYLLLSLHPHELQRLGKTPDDILQWLNQFGYQHEVLERDHEIHVLSTCHSIDARRDEYSTSQRLSSAGASLS
jgi:FkbM family methyltransferase